MNEIQLETFLAIAKYRSYSKVAEKMNVTQPTVTSRIKSLEAEIACELFKRIGHEITLTKEGHIFQDYAKNILTSMKHAKEITNITKDPTIRVGFSPGYSYSFIVELLEAVQEIKDFNIQIIEGYDSLDLNNKFLAGEIDLIFNRNALFNRPGVETEYLFDNKLVLLLAFMHPLSTKQTITLDDLEGETIISFRRKTALWEEIDKQLIQVSNLKRIDVDNNEMLKRAVKNNIGIGIIPSLGIDKSYKNKLKVKKVEEIYAIPNSVYVQYRKNSVVKAAAKKIIYSIINHKYANTYEEIQ